MANHVSSAVIAGGIADVVTNPLWIVRTRMQTEAIHLDYEVGRLRGEAEARGAVYKEGSRKLSSIKQTVGSIYKEGGVVAFYRGLSASMLGLSHVAIQFPVYEGMKKEVSM